MKRFIQIVTLSTLLMEGTVKAEWKDYPGLISLGTGIFSLVRENWKHLATFSSAVVAMGIYNHVKETKWQKENKKLDCWVRGLGEYCDLSQKKLDASEKDRKKMGQETLETIDMIDKVFAAHVERLESKVAQNNNLEEMQAIIGPIRLQLLEERHQLIDQQAEIQEKYKALEELLIKLKEVKDGMSRDIQVTVGAQVGIVKGELREGLRAFEQLLEQQKERIAADEAEKRARKEKKEKKYKSVQTRLNTQGELISQVNAEAQRAHARIDTVHANVEMLQTPGSKHFQRLMTNIVAQAFKRENGLLGAWSERATWVPIKGGENKQDIMRIGDILEVSMQLKKVREESDKKADNDFYNQWKDKVISLESTMKDHNNRLKLLEHQNMQNIQKGISHLNVN